VSLGERWALEAPPSSQIAAAVMPGAVQVMEFHVIARGRAFALLEGTAPLPLETGDIVVFPQGDAHVLCSEPGLKPFLKEPAWVRGTASQPRPIPITYRIGAEQPVLGPPGEEASTVVVCGFLGCAARLFAPFSSALPRRLHLPADRSSPWLAAVIDQAARESMQHTPGGAAVLERLSETMFVDTLRRYLEGLPADATGWFAGVRDRYIGSALAAIHDRPAHGWTVEELGRTVGLSRSALHQRFLDILGQTPAQYIARWRVQLGTEMLRNTQSSVLAISSDVGYASEAAFSRAFKRIVGQPPAAWRRAVRDLAACAPQHTTVSAAA
jgi:AraC-like DNA-binding protein